MRSIDRLHPDTRALVLSYLPQRTEEHVIHAWAALDEARQGIEPLANLAYAERRHARALEVLRHVVPEEKQWETAAELCRLAVDVDRLRAELSSLEVAS